MYLSTLFLFIYSIFTFPYASNLHYFTFTASDGGYESDDEIIWIDEDEQTSEEIYNYGEY